MPWLDAAFPVRMTRSDLVAPDESLRDMLVSVAEAAAVELDQPIGDADTGGEAARRLHAAAPSSHQLPAAPILSAEPPDLEELDRTGQYDLLAGEAQLEAYAGTAVRGHAAAALAGWIPADRIGDLAARLAGTGCSVVPLRRPRGAQAPTLVAGSQARRALTPLVTTYGTIPYADFDPSWLAWASYVLMFGMMFGDAGDGLLVIAAAVALRAGWPSWARRYRTAWPFVGGAGVAATLFGLAYGEFFGPTGVVPVLWLAPLSKPIPLLLVAVGIGAVLLAGAYALGTINRWREGGWPLALYAPSGVAGSALFAGIGVVAAGWFFHLGALLIVGGALAAAALALAAAGFLVEAGGGGFGAMQVSMEIFDLVVRLGSNVASFTRLAAFGLAHAALGLLVWQGTTALWHRGGALIALAILVFAVGSSVAFALEALVAAVQALRLEYYELFSRVFVAQGRPFRPWRLRVQTSAERLVIDGDHSPGQEAA